MPFEFDQEKQQFQSEDSASSEPRSVELHLSELSTEAKPVEKITTDTEEITLAKVFGRILHPSKWSGRQRDIFLLITRIIAFSVAVYGNWIMATERTEETGLATGLPILFLAFLIWVVGDISIGWLQRRIPRELRIEESCEPPELPLEPSRRRFEFWSITLRLFGVVLAFTTSMITLSATSNNRFTVLGVVMWIVSLILWITVFAPPQWNILAMVTSIRAVRLPRGWTLLALIGIMAVAALFRFTDLNGIPSEMTTDHVEKILDSQHILMGNPQVFFPNNGGREPIQFYLMALISQIPGLGMNFFTLKLLTAIEGLICIPVLWWMGREIFGEQESHLCREA